MERIGNCWYTAFGSLAMRVLLCLFLWSTFSPAENRVPEKYLQQLQPPPAPLVEKLIRQLGADSFSERSKAHSELFHQGEGLLVSTPFLHALDSPDLEVQKRARALYALIAAPYQPLDESQFLYCLINHIRKEAQTLSPLLQEMLNAPSLAQAMEEADKLKAARKEAEADQRLRENFEHQFDRVIAIYHQALVDRGYTIEKTNLDIVQVSSISAEGKEKTISFSNRSNVEARKDGKVFMFAFQPCEPETVEVTLIADRWKPLSVEKLECIQEKKLPWKHALPKTLQPGISTSLQLTLGLGGAQPNGPFLIDAGFYNKERGDITYTKWWFASALDSFLYGRDPIVLSQGTEDWISPSKRTAKVPHPSGD